jgi:hypothetical protein
MMRWQVDEVTSRPKQQVHKKASLRNGKLMKLQVDEMES